MLRCLLIFAFIITTTCLFGQADKPVSFVSFGFDYRRYPIDIEDVPRGPSLADKGLPHDDGRFWQTCSIHGKYGLRFQKNWLISASLYGRYNLLHRIENVNYTSPSPTVLEPPQQKAKERRNLKFDLFIEVEKKVKLKKDKENYFFASAGLGFTNINSRFAIVLTDSVESVPFDIHHYKGTLCHFGPRVSIGYQYKKIKTSIDTYVIEDPTLANLTSLWFGATLSYEFMLKKKKAAK